MNTTDAVWTKEIKVCNSINSEKGSLAMVDDKHYEWILPMHSRRKKLILSAISFG